MDGTRLVTKGKSRCAVKFRQANSHVMVVLTESRTSTSLFPGRVMSLFLLRLEVGLAEAV